LLKKFNSLDKLYSEITNNQETITKQITNSNLQKLINGYEAAKLSQILATIKCDVPISFDSAQCSVPSAQVMTDVLKELGYKSLIKRMTGEEVIIDDKQGKLFE
jgi:5'-3' exonuclease